MCNMTKLIKKNSSRIAKSYFVNTRLTSCRYVIARFIYHPAFEGNAPILHVYFDTSNTHMKETVKAAQRLKVTP